MYWFLKYVGLGPWLRLLFQPKVLGKKNVPRRGPIIVASSHSAFIDSLFLPLALPRRIVFLAKLDYFTGTGFRGRLQRWFFSSVGQVPIDRAGGKRSQAALSTGVRVLSEGKVLGIYPEGTRSLDGRLHRGRTGAARLALASGVSIVPAAVLGTFEAQPKGVVLPRPGRITIKFGQPIPMSRYAGREVDAALLREVTDELMWRIQQLSGQEYVDLYVQEAEKLKHRTWDPRVPLQDIQERGRQQLQDLQGQLNALPDRIALSTRLPGRPLRRNIPPVDPESEQQSSPAVPNDQLDPPSKTQPSGEVDDSA